MKYSYSNMGSYLYSRLPHYHRVVDEQNELLLKRFMEVINVGFKTNDDALTQALQKTQASKCGEESLEELAKSLGADWITSIDPSYQRTVIRMLIKLYKQKGTIDTIRFIASELSGFEAKIVEDEIPIEYFEEGDEKKRLLTIKLQAPELDDPVQAQQHESTISEVISNFVPVHTKFILVVTYFYNEDYYKRIPYKDTSKTKQDLGEQYKVFRDDYILMEKLKFSYDTETKFHMLLGYDIPGLLTNPLYKLTNNFYTTKTRNDILHHSNLVMKYASEKTIEVDITSSHVFRQDLGDTSINLDIKCVKEELSMVQSILEDEPITTDLGIHKCVMRLGSPKSKLSTKEGRLTIPSYIDKIRQNGTLTYIYE